jgi:hypothetical protein
MHSSPGNDSGCGQRQALLPAAAAGPGLPALAASRRAVVSGKQRPERAEHGMDLTDSRYPGGWRSGGRQHHRGGYVAAGGGAMRSAVVTVDPPSHVREGVGLPRACITAESCVLRAQVDATFAWRIGDAWCETCPALPQGWECRAEAQDLALEKVWTGPSRFKKVVSSCYIVTMLKGSEARGTAGTAHSRWHRALPRSTPLQLSFVSSLNKACSPDLERLCQASLRCRLKKNPAKRDRTTSNATTLAGTAMSMALAFAVGLSAGSNLPTTIDVGTLI